MRSLFLICALHILVVASGQIHKADSLKQLLATTPANPERVNIYQELSYAYLASYPDTAMQYALEGLKLAREIKDLRGESFCLNALGNVYFNSGDYPLSLDMYFQSLKIKEGLKDQERNIAVTYFNIVNVYTEQDDYEHALDYLQRAKQIDEKMKDTSGIMFDPYSLSSIYLRLKNADSALYYIERTDALARKLEANDMYGAITNTYGGIYQLKKDRHNAEKYFRLSVHYCEEVKDNEVLGFNYSGLAELFKDSGQQDSAIYYLQKSLQVVKEGNFTKLALESTTMLKDLFKARNQYDSAFKYLELSTAAKDSMFSAEKMKKVQNMKLMELQRQHVIQTATMQFRNKVKLYIVVFASGIFLVIAIWLWRNNQQKQKAYALIQEQKPKTEAAYQELKLTQNQLIQSEKMASLGELTAGIAHEIQNPLNFVNNFSEVNAELIGELKAEKLKPKSERNEKLEDEIINDIAQNLDKIHHHGQRADAIVKGMMQHSRASTGQKEATNINALTDEYLRLACHGLRAKDKTFNSLIQTNYDDSIDNINVIPEDFGRAILNLINNAFYTVNEKKKLVSTSSDDQNYEPVVSVTTSKKNGKIEIKIGDNGNGIPKKNLEKIFRPFFTTKPTGQGTGLGLSIAYDIITKGHGGDIKVQTQEGKGSEFIIQLPHLVNG